MSFVKAAGVAEVGPDSALEVTVNDRPYAICNSGGKLYALDGVCPHQGGPLGYGQVHDGKVMCPFHMWEFDCATGEYDRNPSLRVATFPVKVEDGQIYIQVD